MSITGSTRQTTTRFALPLADVGKLLWDRLSARRRQPSYSLPLDARLLRDIGVVGGDDITQVSDDVFSSQCVSAGTFLQSIQRSACRRGETES